MWVYHMDRSIPFERARKKKGRRYPHRPNEALLYGLGLGLYWGEGSKRGKGGMRLANTDPLLIRMFIEFLNTFFAVKKEKSKFGLQIFGDISPDISRGFWMKELGLAEDQFYKIIISKVRGEGTYAYKSEYGVLMVCFNNTRLKRLLCDLIKGFDRNLEKRPELY